MIGTLLAFRDTSQIPRAHRVRRAGALPWLPILGATVVLFLATWAVVPNALSATSLQAMLPFAAIMAIAACGQTLVVQNRGIDLSTSGTITLAATITVMLTAAGQSVAFVLVIVAATVVAIGVVNGLLIAKLSITPLIATLAVNAALTGAALLVSNGATANAPDVLTEMVTTRILGQQVLVWISGAVVAIVGIVMARTSLGRTFTFVGTSPSAARSIGIRTSRYLVGSYVASAVLSGVAGVLLVSFLRTSSATIGSSYQLSVIAAVVVGGTSLLGGRGSVVASAIAALFLSQLSQTALTLGAPSSTQLLLQSAAIAVAASVGLLARRVDFRRLWKWRRRSEGSMST